jgi:phosphatidyl-myo-inositol dimannoside synthase
MKTLLLAPELFTVDSGIPRVLRAYLGVLCETATGRHQVSFITLNDQLIESRDLRRLPPERLRSWSACGGRKSRFIRETWREARRHHRILCGHLALGPVAWTTRLRYRKLQYIVLAHGIEAWRRLSALQRVALRGASRVICVSDYTRQRLLRHNRLDPARLTVVPNGLDPEFAIGADLEETARPPTILTVSRLSAADTYKGIDHLIQAMPAVRRTVPDARLRIIGRGADQARLYALARQQGLSGAIEFSGYVPDGELRAAFGSARVFALPSSGEGFGLVYVEALAAGTPCVAADVGGAPEILTSETGLLVRYGEVERLATVLVSALQRTWSRPAILARAREFSYERFRTCVSRVLASIG